MDGLCRVAGSPVGVRLAGRTYLLEPMTLRRWGSVEAHLLSDPAGFLAGAFHTLAWVQDPGLHKEIFDRVRWDAADQLTEAGRKVTHKHNRVVPMEAVRLWAYTKEGLAYTAWLCLLDRYPEFLRLEDVAAAVGGLTDRGRADLTLRRDVASGTDLLSSLDWPDAIDPFAGMRKQGLPSMKYMPWKAVYRRLQDESGWGPEVVGGLTLYELKLYTVDAKEAAGVAQVDAVDADALPESVKRDVSRFRERQLMKKG